MKCKNLQPNLLDYSQGLLSPQQASKIRAHLLICADCKTVLDEEMALTERLCAETQPLPKRDIWDVVQARIQKSPQRRSLFDLLSVGAYGRKFAAVAAVLTVLIIGLFAFTGYRSGVAEKERVKEAIALMQTQPDKTTVDTSGGTTDAMIQVLQEQVPKDEM
jgi:hypothetical protein